MESTTLEDYVGGLNHIYIQNIYFDESKQDNVKFSLKNTFPWHIYFVNRISKPY